MKAWSDWDRLFAFSVVKGPGGAGHVPLTRPSSDKHPDGFLFSKMYHFIELYLNVNNITRGSHSNP